jgi:hypothetical protein
MKAQKAKEKKLPFKPWKWVPDGTPMDLEVVGAPPGTYPKWKRTSDKELRWQIARRLRDLGKLPSRP